jgi:hypothetical protein
MASLSGVLDGIDYHQFYLVTDDDEVSPEFETDPEIAPHWLITPSGHALYIHTGVAMGMVNLTVELLEGGPPEIDQRQPWAAVSETSFEAAGAEAWVRLLMDDPPPPFDDPLVLADGPGWYRVRAHALGRELDYDLVVDDQPREHHLLQLWRTAGPEPTRHHRVDDQWSAQGSA